ncbi:MAG: hypothetical protein NT001_00345 [Candidatus Woesearchaeota archaeon]|nr:hypothetical protein [Candidatus Woesearchaeota archaeon]
MKTESLTERIMDYSGRLAKKGLRLAAAGAIVLGSYAAQVSAAEPPKPEEPSLIDRYNNSDSRIRLFVEGGLEPRMSNPIREIKNIPEDIRFVRIHPDDDYADPNDNGPIQDSYMRGPPLIEFRALKIGLETELIDKVYLDLYGELDLNIMSRGEINERNYTNHPGTDKRGYGAALTYNAPNFTPIPIIEERVDLRFPLNDTWRMGLGFGYREYDLVIEKGWDRNDDYEVDERVKIADIEETAYYLSMMYVPDFDRDEDKKRVSLDFTLGIIDVNTENEKANVVPSNPGVSFSVGLNYRLF